MTHLVCPACSDASELLSIETAKLGYSITAHLADDGTRSIGYGDRDYLVYDEDTKCEDDFWCMTCSWAGPIADLEAEASA